MKRIPCIAIACLILTLSGCAVKSAADAETVCDLGSGPEPPQFCLTAELPAELQRSAEDSAEGRSVYTRADGAYEVVIETAAGAPDAVLRQLTGREAAALDPVYLAWPQADQYQFAWTGADDEGELACCGTLLYDGTTCYTLTIRCAAELEKTYHAEFARILAHTRLTDAAATPDELSAFLQGLDCFFAKPSRGTCGNGIEKLRTADWPDAEKLLAYLKEKGLDVLEEPLAQHPDMAKLHPQSVNTMRIVTDRVVDTVHIAYIVLKIGRGDGFCDNSGHGGVICRVDEKTGKICSVATDDYFNVYETHPDTGIRFEGYQLPMVQEAVDFARKAALVVPQICHVGWDVAVTPDGPVLIEGNDYPGTDLCQLAPHYPEKQGLWPYYKEILNIK